jgi:hypothetical protein
MEKLFLLSVILLISLTFFNCSVEQAKKENGSSKTTGQNYQEMVPITGGTYVQTEGGSSFIHTWK